MAAGAVAICCACIFLLGYLAYLAACIAAPALATRAMVEYGQSSENTEGLWKWHAGLGYGLLLMSLLFGKNRWTTSLFGKKDIADVEAQQVSLKPGFTCCCELAVGLGGLAMTIGLLVTSFKLYFEQNDLHGLSTKYNPPITAHINSLLFYSAICGIIVSVVALIWIPIGICCSFCAFCTGIITKCLGKGGEL